MLQTEYIRNLNCNYERILLEKKPEENRYQYCIVGRGGVRRLLPCSLRYINGEAYLYYDISSMQSIFQLYMGRCVGRSWIRNFFWSMKQIRHELERFLLDDRNLVWYPEHIFQDLEKEDFSFLYIPYYEGENGFRELLNFLVEHIDYEDEELVECVYGIYEQYETAGDEYLKYAVFEDIGRLKAREPLSEEAEGPSAEEAGDPTAEEAALEARFGEERRGEERTKRGILRFLGAKRRKQKEEREAIQRMIRQETAAYAVAEDSVYAADASLQEAGSAQESSGYMDYTSGTGDAEPPEQELSEEAPFDGQEDDPLGRTMYIEPIREKVYRLFDAEGKVICILDRPSLTLGKKRGEADCVLEDVSVSRLHARITREGDTYYLEDMNSTNGTCQNGQRLRPYEKRKLHGEDEICLGKTTLIFR